MCYWKPAGVYKKLSLDAGTGVNWCILIWGVKESQSLHGNDVRGFSPALHAQGAAFLPQLRAFSDSSNGFFQTLGGTEAPQIVCST